MADSFEKMAQMMVEATSKLVSNRTVNIMNTKGIILASTEKRELALYTPVQPKRLELASLSISQKKMSANTQVPKRDATCPSLMWTISLSELWVCMAILKRLLMQLTF